MKNAPIILLSALSTLSFAHLSYAIGDATKHGGKDASWQDILNSPTYVVEDKKINFSGTMVHVLDTCMLDDNTIRSAKKITNYEWDNKQSDDNGPSSLEKQYLTSAKKTTKTYSDYDSTVEQEELRSSDYMLSVFFRDAHESAKPAFIKSYTIPDC